jgi:hypothetical protein
MDIRQMAKNINFNRYSKRSTQNKLNHPFEVLQYILNFSYEETTPSAFFLNIFVT